MLTENNDKSTGISALSQGLNKDAISTQNSQGLVDNMMKASGQRGKIMARNFAVNFLVPLMLEVVRLAIIHKDKRVIEVAGAPLNIDAEQWTERTTCTVSQHSGLRREGHGRQQAGAGLPDAGEGSGSRQHVRTQAALRNAARHLQAQGFNRFASYLDPNAPPPQPDPIKMRELDRSRTRQRRQRCSPLRPSSRTTGSMRSIRRRSSRRSRHPPRRSQPDRTNDRQDADTAARIQQGEEQIDVEREKIAAQERTAARNAAAPQPGLRPRRKPNQLRQDSK
jgi:hypothetical protein